MCNTKTPKEKQVLCSRCGKVANPDDSWIHDWPLYGRIEVGFPSQAFAALGGAKHIADREHFIWWRRGHPALITNEAQEICFLWGNGYKYDSRGRYRLCYDCQRELLNMLGRFFGIDKEIDRIRKGLSNEKDE